MLSKPLMTLHEVADLLKVKESTVRTWIRDRSLRAIKFGKDWRVSQPDLEQFVEAHANRPAHAMATVRDMSHGAEHNGFNGEANGKDTSKNGASGHR
jgi:excisionase family DNA binding protein